MWAWRPEELSALRGRKVSWSLPNTWKRFVSSQLVPGTNEPIRLAFHATITTGSSQDRALAGTHVRTQVGKWETGLNGYTQHRLAQRAAISTRFFAFKGRPYQGKGEEFAEAERYLEPEVREMVGVSLLHSLPLPVIGVAILGCAMPPRFG